MTFLSFPATIVPELEGFVMAWSYKPLWHLLINRNMKRSELLGFAGINSATLAKMGKDLPVTMNALDKLCNALGCRVEDIVEHIPDT